MKIPMVDLKVSYESMKADIDNAVKTVLDKTNFILGEEVGKFEEEFAKYCGSKYAVGVANGTDAIKISLLACGLEKEDEVITTPFTFIATSEAIIQSGCKPVFADIRLDDYNLDPVEIEKKLTKKTKAVIPVHLYGHPCDMKKIMEIAKKNNLIVIEDCAQAFSAKYEDKFTGTIGNAGSFSFFPAKNLGCFGDGGMVITNDQNVYKNARALRNHGSHIKYYSEMDGFNSRLDTLQAAILSVKLKQMDKWTKMRNDVAGKYAKALKDVTAVPKVLANCYHSFNYYNIMFASKQIRDQVQKYLVDNGVACQIYYPVALHLQTVYKDMGYKLGDFPLTEKAQDTTLSLPMYPELNDEQIKYITEKVKEAVG
ncbi:MAG: DegT/DnrJ/EryC1/StrS family aminotransferase [Elusimicrobia bacterium]|nr:DegT/DnrJ/EryC1/StrS family aminotransferase [Candidatus Liberimonas magnetica]